MVTKLKRVSFSSEMEKQGQDYLGQFARYHENGCPIHGHRYTVRMPDGSVLGSNDTRALKEKIMAMLEILEKQGSALW